MAGRPKIKRGRPKESLEDKIDFKLVTNAGKLGLIDTEIAVLFDVTERTINRWKKNERFLSALKKGKLEPDNEVVESLLKRAKGYDYVEETIEYDAKQSVNADGTISDKPKIKSVKRVKKHVVADTLAATVWLNNRRPESWKRYDRDDGSQLSDAELKALKEKAAELMKESV